MDWKCCVTTAKVLEEVNKRKFKVVIADESHYLKDQKSQRSKVSHTTQSTMFSSSAVKIFK
jgi:hypothetical protein